MRETPTNGSTDERSERVPEWRSITELPQAALRLHADGRIVEANAAAVALTGYEATELLNQLVTCLFGSETDVELARKVQSSCERQQIFADELVCYKRSGAAFWNDLVVVPDASDHDQASMLALLRDVTARRTAAKALGVDISHDRMIMDRIQAAIVVHSASTEILYANALATDMLGVTYDSVLGTAHTDPRWKFVGPDGQPLAHSEYPVVKTLVTKTAQHGLVVGALRVNDQSPRWAICNSYPVMDESGTICEVVVSFTDITELKATQHALQKSEERLRLALQGSNDAPWDWDLDTNELYYSPRWWEMIGYGPDELPNDAFLWTRLLHPDDNPSVPAQLEAWFASDVQTYEVEARLQHKSGHYVSMLSRGFILRDAAGKARRISGTNADITERRALEERLHQSQKMQAIGQLAGGVAHDFNNLLAVIVGNLELLRNAEPRGSDAGECLNDALAAAQRGAELTRSLLTYSRQQPVETKIVDVAQLVSNLGLVLRRIIPASIRIDVHAPQPPMRIRIDAGLLENALLNLCINARDAMPGGGTLSLSVERLRLTDPARCQELELEPGAYVRVNVKDTGTGMTAEIVRRSVEPFFTTKPVGSGTGLGLSLVYAFVQQSGGALHIDSALAEGAHVQLYLPAGDVVTDDQMAAPPETQNVKGAHPELVLVVEDDASVRRLCVRSLTTLGYRTLQAATGPEALRVLEASPDVDLVLTDIVMPDGMSGKQLADEIARRWPEVCLVYMSGYTAHMLDEVDDSPSRQLLTKPFTIAQLGTALRSALNERNADTE